MSLHEQPTENTDSAEKLENQVENPAASEQTETTAAEQDATDEDGAAKKRKRGARGGAKTNPTPNNKQQELEAEIEKLNAELAEAKDKYLRLYAEFDNYRKRTSRESLELRKVASQDVIKGLLPALDDFERAIRIAAEPSSAEKMPEGVVLVFQKLTRALELQGLKPMESNGTVFDAELHEAITKIPAPNAELKGRVIDTVEKGYYLNDKIIRYAKVVVGQ